GLQAVAAEYAKALLSATEKSGSSTETLEQLESIVHDVVAKQPKFAAALSSPRFALEHKLRLVEQAFGGRVLPELLQFFKVLARHGRLNALRPISRAFRKLYNEAHARVEVVVTTAEPLPSDLRDRLIATLTQKVGKEIDLVQRIDADVLGGMVVRMGDTVYDASLANRLERQRQQALRRSVAHLQQEISQVFG
ncbi:MAG: ATP synthase F1 subunit delta, partial [Planctomycetales bacterium]|nr:ATP synthase F1 subunit delta [Planctomycetales bacterium]